MSEWRPVPGYEGLYEISDEGQVRSNYSGKILKPCVREYLQVTLYREKRQRTHSLHVLTATAFHGPRPEGMQVRHLDGNKHNNVATNLAYGTQQENSADALAHGQNGYAKRTECPYGHSYLDLTNVIYYRRQRFCRACKQWHSVEKEQRRRERAARVSAA